MYTAGLASVEVRKSAIKQITRDTMASNLKLRSKMQAEWPWPPVVLLEGNRENGPARANLTVGMSTNVADENLKRDRPGYCVRIPLLGFHPTGDPKTAHPSS